MNLFRSLYSHLSYTHRIDSLLSPKKLQIEQENDIICATIIDFIKGRITLHEDKRKNSIHLQNLHTYYSWIFNNLDQFYLNENNILCIKPDQKHPHHRLVVPI